MQAPEIHICGTAIEAPMRITYQVEVIKGKRSIQEPQYETDEYYAVTAFGTTLDFAAKKALRYMIDYLEQEHGLNRTEAYVLCSLAGDLEIAEVVDVPHVLVYQCKILILTQINGIGQTS